MRRPADGMHAYYDVVLAAATGHRPVRRGYVVCSCAIRVFNQIPHSLYSTVAFRYKIGVLNRNVPRATGVLTRESRDARAGPGSTRATFFALPKMDATRMRHRSRSFSLEHAFFAL